MWHSLSAQHSDPFAQLRQSKAKSLIPVTIVSATAGTQDTLVHRLLLHNWYLQKHYPFPLRITNTPFSVGRSSLHGLGLLLDTTSVFNVGDTVLTVFSKTKDTGYFAADYAETALGQLVNDSNNPTTRVAKVPFGLVLIATRPLVFGIEVSYAYKDVIALFPNDTTVRAKMQYE
jgi:hypothetical protein